TNVAEKELNREETERIETSLQELDASRQPKEKDLKMILLESANATTEIVSALRIGTKAIGKL
ncbi:hypothetical protein IFM89_011650, partial [Coptis chinensis]